MGPMSGNNLCIAPAFFITQVDIFWATIKIWFLIFCCCATGAVDMKIIEYYSINNFNILAFVIFSCEVGYPKNLTPDAGSQFIKGCQTMIIKFSDVNHKLHEEYGDKLETCPVGAHYMHGEVERKIRHVGESFQECNEKNPVVNYSMGNISRPNC